MGIVAVKIKIMPESAETDLTKVEKEVRKRIEKNSVKNPQFEVQPIAFGLKALIVLFGWPEEKEFEGFEKEMQKIKGVGSVEVIDMRRAIG
jgi:translation elongation factor aEF-1 beta